MKSIAGLIISLFSLSYSFHVTHRATCTKKLLCNGNLMCAYVCEKGSVEVDQWASKSLSYQQKLQRSDKFLYYEMPSTHNSAINEADGFGIEKYFISALGNGMDFDQGDDVGEGVCQYLSLTDQLRIGIRHIEIDIWWGPLENDIVVCHSPIPLFPVGKVTRAAAAQNISLEWEPAKMSCLGTKRLFGDVLKEVRDWMVLDENKEEIVMLYFDTKFYLAPNQVTQANNEIVKIFGPLVWKASDGDPTQQTVQQLLSARKRLIIENGKECWTKPLVGEQVVFYPTLWTHQFGADSFFEFSNCTVEGDRDWYGKQMVRALDGSFIEAATRCGVQFASKDYVNPDEMKLYVWSWDQQKPSQLENACAAMQPNGRWMSLDCATELPYACLKANDETGTQWTIDITTTGPWTAKPTCPEGSIFAAPHNGYSNALLLNAGYGQRLWLNAPIAF